MWALQTLEWSPLIDWEHKEFVLTPYDGQTMPLTQGAKMAEERAARRRVG